MCNSEVYSKRISALLKQKSDTCEQFMRNPKWTVLFAWKEAPDLLLLSRAEHMFGAVDVL